MSDMPVRPVCPTWHRTILSDAMSDVPVRQDCPTWHRTVNLDAMSDKLFDGPLDQFVRCEEDK
ncbi:hypothetical protein Pst134EB_014739 [Puccinia striiformis f. sp. tritici]|nr:hypothetical protein Pst134EB_014739 [Puccinia striiformis f. sp. tritici]